MDKKNKLIILILYIVGIFTFLIPMYQVLPAWIDPNLLTLFTVVLTIVLFSWALF